MPIVVSHPVRLKNGERIWAYSIDILPPAWRTVSLFNPIVYLISGFRWSFYGTSDVGVEVSLVATLAFIVLYLVVVV